MQVKSDLSTKSYVRILDWALGKMYPNVSEMVKCIQIYLKMYPNVSEYGKI